MWYKFFLHSKVRNKLVMCFIPVCVLNFSYVFYCSLCVLTLYSLGFSSWDQWWTISRLLCINLPSGHLSLNLWLSFTSLLPTSIVWFFFLDDCGILFWLSCNSFLASLFLSLLPNFDRICIIWGRFLIFWFPEIMYSRSLFKLIKF